jgi:calpain-5
MVQLRNPWGRSEWKGAWSDNSKEWNQKRRRMVMERQAKKAAHDKISIGADDGVFWMTFNDFTLNFASVDTCSLIHLDKNYALHKFSGRFSKADKTAGGGTNCSTLMENPQWEFKVEGGKEVEIQIDLSVRGQKVLISCEVLDIGGRLVES